MAKRISQTEIQKFRGGFYGVWTKMIGRFYGRVESCARFSRRTWYGYKRDRGRETAELRYKGEN